MGTKLYLFVWACFVFISCSNSMQGKIEMRHTKPTCVNFEILDIPTVDTTTVVVPIQEAARLDTTVVVTPIDAGPYTSPVDEAKAKIVDHLKATRDEIEKNTQHAYVVNSSTSDSYAFTIKVTPNDSTAATTSIIELGPGEEKSFGCDTYITNDLRLVQQKFEIVGQQKVLKAAKF